MGKAPKVPATQTVTNVTQLPAWVDKAGQDNLTAATEVADNLKGPYTGNLVPKISQDQNDAFQMVRDNANNAQPAINQGIAAAGAAAGYQPDQVGASTITAPGGYRPDQVNGSNVTAGSFLSGDISKYLSPMTAEIENRATANLERQRQSAMTDIGSKAAGMHAFGGSRQGILEGVTNAESARAAGDLSANLRGDAFERAAALMGTDQNRDLQAQGMNQGNALQAGGMNQAANARASEFGNTQQMQAGLANQAAEMQAGLANQAAGLNANQQRLLASGQLGQLGTQGQQAALQGASALQSAGSAQQQQEAMELQQQGAQYDAERNFPLEQLNIKMNALGLTPYGKTQTTTGPSNQQQPNSGMNALGGAMSGLSIASSLGAGTGMSALGGGLGALLGLFSDEDEKTNIQPLGKDPQSGLPIYAYDYKADVAKAKKSGGTLPPKRVGPMAQDIEKAAPGSTRKIGGKRIVSNLGFGPLKVGAR